jgi:hypothetical protein
VVRAIGWTQYDRLKAEGLAYGKIARQWGIPWGAFHREKQKRGSAPPVHSRTPATRRRHTRAHPSIPASHPTRAHRGTPNLSLQKPTMVHPGTPIPNDIAVRLLPLLPDLEVIVACERERQGCCAPIGTPRHTVKKMYVVDTLYVDLIELYAHAEGVEFKEVMNLSFHEFFERRGYLPSE